jgi:hypothetical protein
VPTLSELLDGGAALAGLAAHLDGLTPEARSREALALDGRRQKALFSLAAEGTALKPEALVPESRVETEFAFRGRNSMPFFSRFEKRFFRAETGELYGYNKQAMSWLTGPGYFRVLPSPRDERELLFDYTQLPAHGPDGGPAVRPNTGRSAPFFGGMHDYVRRVSDGCLIGWAFKDGRDLQVTFVLVR